MVRKAQNINFEDTPVKLPVRILKTTKHKVICQELHDIYIKKNADYGDSFGEQFKEYGIVSSVIRMDDKMRRLKQLTKQDAQVKDESIADTLRDLANYAIMTLMEWEQANGTDH